MSDGNLVRASGLWLKDGKSGKFFSGKVDTAIPAGAAVFVFRNDKKENDKQPDYTLCFAELNLRGDHFEAIGRARRRSSDRPIPVVGEELATARALGTLALCVMEAAQEAIEQFLDD